MIGLVAAVIFGGAIAIGAAARGLERARVRGGLRADRRAQRAAGARRASPPSPTSPSSWTSTRATTRTSRSSSARRSTTCPTCCARRWSATSPSSSPTRGAATAPTACTRATARTRDNYPDRIIIFRDTLRRDFGHDADLLREQVTITVRHELAHHIGFDELGVRDLGL